MFTTRKIPVALFALFLFQGCARSAPKDSPAAMLDLLTRTISNSSNTTSQTEGPPTVVSTSPADGATGVNASVAISITFSEAMATGTISTNSAGTVCSGSLQLSEDNFTTCVQMTAAPVASGGDTVFTVQPLAILTGSSTYKIRVSAAVTDVSGTALAAIFTQPTGFTTAGNKKLFITTATHNGDFDNDGALTGGGATNANGNGIEEADRFCTIDGNYPGSGTFKAVLVDGANRRACSAANCGTAAPIDWVLSASTAYYRVDGTTQVLSTNGNGIFVFGTLTNSTGTGAATYWTGLAADWTTDAKICTSWTDPSGGANQGNKGSESATGGTSFGGMGGPPQCNNTYALLCAEQ